MRIWLVEEQHADGRPALEVALRQLADCPGDRLTVLGTGLLRPGHLTELRGWQLDVVVVPEHLWPAEPEAQALLDLEVGVLVVAPGDQAGRFLALAETYPVSLVAAPRQAEDLWPALLGALGARRRYLQWKGRVASLQARLDDRIIIERAKGILAQRLGLAEEDAYKRLRVSSRRQRRPIRDIAQSLLDTEALLQPGAGDCVNGETPGLRKIL